MGARLDNDVIRLKALAPRAIEARSEMQVRLQYLVFWLKQQIRNIFPKYQGNSHIFSYVISNKLKTGMLLSKNNQYNYKLIYEVALYSLCSQLVTPILLRSSSGSFCQLFVGRLLFRFPAKGCFPTFFAIRSCRRTNSSGQ